MNDDKVVVCGVCAALFMLFTFIIVLVFIDKAHDESMVKAGYIFRERGWEKAVSK